MKYIKLFEEFINEKKKKESFEDKIKGHGYFKGLSVSTSRKKAAQMKKQAEMDDDDPDAYQPMPGSTKGKKLLKKSKYTKAYDELYGEAIMQEGVMSDIHRMIDDSKTFDQFQKEFFKEYGHKKVMKKTPEFLEWLEALYNDSVSESVNEEEKQSTDRSPIDNSAIETGLENKSKETGVPIGILRAVMRRGMAAWKRGHRPGAGQEQWGYARTNSFLVGGEGTWGRPINNPTSGADSDLAREAIKAGFKPKK